MEKIKEITKWLLKQELELKDKVFCKCGKLRTYAYSDMTWCPEELIADEDERYFINHKKHDNDKFKCNHSDLKRWDFLQELKDILIK